MPVDAADVTGDTFEDYLDTVRNLTPAGRWADMARSHLRLAAVAVANAEDAEAAEDDGEI